LWLSKAKHIYPDVEKKMGLRSAKAAGEKAKPEHGSFY
jgi:hypothetical protein